MLILHEIFECQVEAFIHFEDDTEELQQWDQQVRHLSSSTLLHLFQ